MNRAARLLSHGYFPTQLPPGFNTRDLAAHHKTLHAAWVTIGRLQKQNLPVPHAPASKAELFSVARAGHHRRLTSIPNPVAQTFLALEIAEHWPELLRHFRQSTFSASRPRFLKAGARGANIPAMHGLHARKINSAAGYRFALRTDISRFFPTIYTHSVPWAIHGKASAKQNRKLAPAFFGNLLDLALRQGQDQQTIGLPIGPDTSHIIAELIAVAIDLELKKKLNGFPAGFRYVDDYFMFFATAQEAEAALAVLIRALKNFELQANFEKTITCPVIELTDDYWRHQLRSFQISKSGRKQASDIHHFFELSKDLAKRNSDESVMIYALKRMSSVIIRAENWTAFEAHLCHVALSFPNTIQFVARLLSTYSLVGYKLQSERLSRLVNAIIEDHAPLGHHSEVAWALWICKELDLILSAPNIDRVAEMHSSVCALILLDQYHSGKLMKAPDLKYWQDFANTDALSGDLWLLAYEAGVRAWGGFTSAAVTADNYFEQLWANGVRFYDQNKRIKPIFTPKANALAKRHVTSFSELFSLPDVEEYLQYDNEAGGYDDIGHEDDDESDLASVSPDSDENDEDEDPNLHDSDDF